MIEFSKNEIVVQAVDVLETLPVEEILKAIKEGKHVLCILDEFHINYFQHCSTFFLSKDGSKVIKDLLVTKVDRVFMQAIRGYPVGLNDNAAKRFQTLVFKTWYKRSELLDNEPIVIEGLGIFSMRPGGSLGLTVKGIRRE